jgi:predicted nucleotidyltransferase
VHDPVVDAFKKNVDRSLLVDNLRLTPEQRSQKFLSLIETTYKKHRAAEGFRVSSGAAFPETDFAKVLDVFNRGGIRFIVIGAVAAMAHGRVVVTNDVDVVYSRDGENICRLVNVIAQHQPYLMAPKGLRFAWNEQNVKMGLNFTLTTSLGDIDLFGAMIGAGGYDQLLAHSAEMIIVGVKCRCVTLERIIQMKRAAGRPRDLPVMAELLALLEERRKMERGESS